MASLFWLFATVAYADTNANCADWAAAGECEANPGYMLDACKDACSAYAYDASPVESFYDLTAMTAELKSLDFKSLRGKVVLVTNVASQ